MAGDGDAGLATSLGLDLLGDVVDDRRTRALGELFLVLLLGQRRVLLGDSALGDGYDGKAAAGLHAMLDGLDDVVHVVGDLGNQDDVRAARDAGIQRNPTDLVAHDLDDKHAAVTRGSGVDVVDALGGDVDGARKAKGHLGAPGVVVDGLGQGDNVEALFAQAVGSLGGAVAAQHKQAVELQLVIGVDHRRHLLDAIGLGNIQTLERRAARAQDGAAAGEDAAKIGGRHDAEPAVDKALVAVLKTIDLDRLFAIGHECFDDATHGGVERLAVAATGKKTDPEHDESFRASYNMRISLPPHTVDTGVKRVSSNV